MSQSLLLHSRFGRYIDTTCFRDHVVGLTANSYWTYQGQGIYPFGLPSELDKKGAETFHHILCLNTLDALRAGRSVYPEAEAIPAITVADCQRCLSAVLLRAKEKRGQAMFDTLAAVFAPLVSRYESRLSM
ncbi:hypothetical protein AAT19DRAFT_16292 [Rhodotorula toruloides]|uniref:Uncharacterized protein n=1 Tax=Rhodotorula toruloides TaxID=5286 RepID=A0A2T0A2X2_RHOTO|nr:hypothetical protein AAT19DRAFT_16292 [Rhodotorula toruloides]